MNNNKLNIRTDLSYAAYQKKHKNFAHKLVTVTEAQVLAFDRKYGYTNKFLLQGKKWCKINDRYYEMPKAAGFNWFRNLNVAGKSAVSLLACGVIGGAVATPFIINSNKNIVYAGNHKVEIRTSGGAKIIRQPEIDTETGDLVATVEVEGAENGQAVTAEPDSVEIIINNKDGTQTKVDSEDVYVGAGENENENTVTIDGGALGEDDSSISYNISGKSGDSAAEEQKEVEEGTEAEVYSATEVPEEEAETEEEKEMVDVTIDVDQMKDPESGEEKEVRVGNRTSKDESKKGQNTKGKKVRKVKIKGDGEKINERINKMVFGDDVQIDIEEDTMTGKKPSSLKNLKNLQELYLPKNKKNKEIPSNFCNGRRDDTEAQTLDKLHTVKGLKNVETMNEMAFYGCGALRDKLSMPNCKTMGANAFGVPDDKVDDFKKSREEYKNEHNKYPELEVNLSDNLEFYPKNGFTNQLNLTKSKGGKNTTAIHNECYKNCFNLREVDSLGKDNKLKEIHEDAFRNTNITEVHLNSTFEYKFDSEYGRDSFRNCGMLADVHLNNEKLAGLESNDFFDHCGILDNAKRVYLPDSYPVWYGVYKNFEPAEKQEKPGYRTFEVKTNKTNEGDKHHCFAYEFSYDEETPKSKSYAYRYEGYNDTHVDVPECADGYSSHPVDAVCSFGFQEHTKVTSVYLNNPEQKSEKEPVYITKLGTDVKRGYSFLNCKNLNSVTDFDGKNDYVTMIAANTFDGCALDKFYMPTNLTHDNFGEDVFKNHQHKQMELHLEYNTDYFYNDIEDKHKMFEASNVVYLDEDAKVPTKTYLNTHFKQVETKSGEPQKWVRN